MRQFLFPKHNEPKPDAWDMLEDIFTLQTLAKDQRLAEQQEECLHEFILVQGVARAYVLDEMGRETVIGLYAAPCVITPHIARTEKNVSLCHIEMIGAGIVAVCKASVLLDLMVQDKAVRDWANNILQQELLLKARREWCLAALPAIRRLEWFRQCHPNGEAIFPHHQIASWLGMTAVSLSRVRQQLS